MKKLYDTIVYIGRFQPFHNGHLEVVKHALTLADKLVIIIGSADQPRTFKNPFNTFERTLMIEESLSSAKIADDNIAIETVKDTLYNDQGWICRIQEIVAKHTDKTSKVALIGHDKDESSYYLNLFPQWKNEFFAYHNELDGTKIRNLYFSKEVSLDEIKKHVPVGTINFLDFFMFCTYYNQIIAEKEFIQKYKEQFASLQYDPVFVTVDALVLCCGHVLLVTRKSEPGKGLYALPGGFLNAKTDKSLLDAMIRELKEETGIKVPVPVLKGSITGKEVFDAVNRSARGRTITHAFRINLSDTELPKVKGSDDAEKAIWVPISLVRSNRMFEDHYEIIQYFVNK